MHGDYVGFVDADDWIDPEMYEVLLQRMIAENAQISCCGMAIVTGEKITRYFNPDMDVQFTAGGADAQSELIRCSCITNAMCDKLYSAEIFDGLRQKTGAYMDDMVVQYLLVAKGRAGNLHGTAGVLLVSVGKQYYTWAFYNALLRMDYQHRGTAGFLSGAFPGVCPGGLQSVYRRFVWICFSSLGRCRSGKIRIRSLSGESLRLLQVIMAMIWEELRNLSGSWSKFTPNCLSG